MFDSLIKKQIELSKKIIEFDCFEKLEYVAGVDVHYFKDKIVVGYALVSYYDNQLVETRTEIFDKLKDLEYKSGFFCFYEGPYIVRFLKKIKKPDVLLIDGHGVAHPRKMGLASYVGVVCDIPTIGCAKNLLYGNYEGPLVDPVRGSFVKVTNGKKVIAYALRTKDNVKEIIISVGHRISLETAKEVVLKLCKLRIPQPLRIAHLLAKSFK